MTIQAHKEPTVFGRYSHLISFISDRDLIGVFLCCIYSVVDVVDSGLRLLCIISSLHLFISK